MITPTLRRAAVVVLALAASVPAGAQAAAADPAPGYPARPIRVIVPFQAGTTTDILVRMIGQRLTEAWGQQVVIDNRPGAASIVGTELGARATPDGYVLVTCGTGAFAVNPGLYPKLPYDPVKDFAPITNLVMTPQTLVAGPHLPVKTTRELVELARAKPGQINYGSFGSGATNHLAMEMLQKAAGIKLNHIPYKGTPAAQADLIGGQIGAMFDTIAAVIPQVRAARLKALGVAMTERSPLAPDVPTIAEAGFPGFEAVGWIGIAAPARTPSGILDKLNLEIVRILHTAEIKERLTQLALSPVGSPRAHFTQYVRTELVKWTQAVKESGARVDF